ncbi:MAG: hypothetical protein ACK554_16670, partial [Erythrobacteraceae bacterium]
AMRSGSICDCVRRARSVRSACRSARALARACGFDSYAALLEAFGAARRGVAQAWKQILGTDILEGEQETD